MAHTRMTIQALVTLAALGLDLPAGPAAAGPVARSGLYDGMVLAVVGNAVSGVFAEQRGSDGAGGAPQFSCVFVLRGRLMGDRATVETWFPGDPERISGVLDFTTTGVGLTLTKDHGGCPMTSGGMADRPYETTRNADVAAAGWIGAGLVTSKRAAFRSSPERSSARARHVVKFDAVAIMGRRNGWVQAIYHGGPKPLVGWLLERDVVVLTP